MSTDLYQVTVIAVSEQYVDVDVELLYQGFEITDE